MDMWYILSPGLSGRAQKRLGGSEFILEWSATASLYWNMIHDKVFGWMTRQLRLVPFFLVLAGFSFGNCHAQTEPSLTRLRQDSRDLLRQEAVAPAGREKDQAIAALCDMYFFLRQDDRYADSSMLQADSAKIRRRLLTVARSRSNQLRRDQIPRPSTLATEIDTAIQAAIEDKKTASELLGSREQSGNGGAAFADEGWRLVELIQQVVAPDFWESRGGPGAVHYFAMRRVLVVRATTDVHEQIKDLLTALR